MKKVFNWTVHTEEHTLHNVKDEPWVSRNEQKKKRWTKILNIQQIPCKTHQTRESLIFVN